MVSLLLYMRKYQISNNKFHFAMKNELYNYVNYVMLVLGSPAKTIGFRCALLVPTNHTDFRMTATRPRSHCPCRHP